MSSQSMLLNNVNCSHNNFIHILQCSYSTIINSDCVISLLLCHGTLLLTDETRIWDSNPFSGMIRLQGGKYVNQGRVEVYCNGQWGTICDNGFSFYDARTVCKQL